MSRRHTGEGEQARVSIVVPVLNEAGSLAPVLQRLQPLRAQGHEVIVADGGSGDGTRDIAAPLADRVIEAPRGRASQMNAGAAAASGAMLLFLHADTGLPAGAPDLIGDAAWGRFDVRIEGRPAMLRVIAALMNWRSRLTGIATGDQAIFVRADAFRALGGYADLPLMEDIDFCRRARAAFGRPRCLRARVTTSGRRWETHGVWRTILLMWRLRAAYWLGADPADLARRYGYVPRAG